MAPFMLNILSPLLSLNRLRAAMTGSTAPVEILEATSPLSALQSLSNSVSVVGVAWLVSSAIFTTYSTTAFLNYQAEKSNNVSKRLSVSRPTLLTLYRFGGSFLLGLIAHPDLQVVRRVKETIQAVPSFALPALFLFVANFCNSISLRRIGISLTYTSKCGIPLITVLLTILLDGTKALPNALAMCSLIPIATGIAAASWNAPSFDSLGFAAAMVSTTSQSLLNVFSKRAMMKTGINGASAQRVMVAVGLIITLVMILLQPKSNKELTVEEQAELSYPPASLSIAAFTAYHIEYVLSFMFVKLVQPITYGAADAVRRLSVILAGRAMFGGTRLTHINIIGIGLALLGAMSYSIASSL